MIDIDEELRQLGIDVYAMDERKTTNRQILLYGPTGAGKGQPLTEEVLTPTGYKQMGDIFPNSWVISNNGFPVQVENIYPLGPRKIYRVSFTDGSFTDCTDDHLWTIRRYDSKIWYTKSVSEIVDYGLGSNDRSFFHIPLTNPINFSNKILKLDPYFLGVFLGDGRFERNRIELCLSQDKLSIWKFLVEKLKISESEFSIYEDSRSEALTIRLFRNDLENYLHKLGFNENTVSQNKFIPIPYIFNTAFNRQELLQGYMDTDGIPSKLECSTSSKQLAEDLKFVVQTLGGKVSSSIRGSGYWNNDSYFEGSLAYRFWIKLPKNICPFKANKKKLLNWKSLESKILPPNRLIEQIELIGEEEAQCIKVKNPNGLYLTNECIVTHNTHQALDIEEILGVKTLFYVNVEKGQLTIEGSQIKGADIRDLDTLSKAMFTLQQACIADRNPYKAIMVDSASDIYDAALRKFTKESALFHPGKDPSVSSQPDYLKTLNRINDMLLFIKELPMHVIFTAQDSTSKDASNIERITPALSPSVVNSFFKYADAVLYMYLNEKEERCALTKPKGRIHAKFRTRVGAPPPPTIIKNPSVGNMFRYWDGEEVEFEAA